VTSLAEAIAQTAKHLAPEHLRTISLAYRPATGYSEQAARAASAAAPAPHRSALNSLNAAWSTSPGVSGESIAVAIDAVVASSAQSDQTDVEVVVTGPDTPAAPVRLTSQVVQQLIDQTEHRVMLVSYSAYRVPGVIAALDRAVARGARVQLVLESPDRLPGYTDVNAYSKYEVYEWPASQRNPPDAKLHAKAVIVDSRDVLLTSANLTNTAYDKSLELGVVCRGGTVAGETQHHFDALIASGVLRRVT